MDRFEPVFELAFELVLERLKDAGALSGFFGAAFELGFDSEAPDRERVRRAGRSLAVSEDVDDGGLRPEVDPLDARLLISRLLREVFRDISRTLRLFGRFGELVDG